MGRGIRVLLVGAGNAQVLAQQLGYYGVDARVITPPRFPNLRLMMVHDVIYGVHLMSLTRLMPFIRLFNRRSVVHIVGSDAFTYVRAKGRVRRAFWTETVRKCDEILYVSEELRRVMGVGRGRVIPIPVDTRMFRKRRYHGRKRDILYYCPRPDIYRLDWILNYARRHPNETITILGGSYRVRLPNVTVIPHVPYHEMPKLYWRHRRLIRMTTHDGRPKMPYEALLCGLEVIWNSRRITEVPDEMLMENTIPKLISVLEELAAD